MFKVLKSAIKKSKPKKLNYSFFNWFNQTTFSSSINQNIKDFSEFSWMENEAEMKKHLNVGIGKFY